MDIHDNAFNVMRVALCCFACSTLFSHSIHKVIICSFLIIIIKSELLLLLMLFVPFGSIDNVDFARRIPACIAGC